VNERVLSAALSNRLKEISALTEAGKAVVSFLELEDVLNVILNAASELLEADEGSVLLVEGEELLVAAATGHASQFLGERRPIDRGLGGYVAASREPVLIDGDVPSREFGESLIDPQRAIASAASVPLEAKGQLLGVLNLNVVTGDRRFTEYDLRALTLFGEHAAMAIRHARALRKERELRTRVAELDRIRAELVGTMTHDLKTPLTTILGSAKLLLRRYDTVDEERRTELIASIERQSQRLLGLIERLLDAARSQARYPIVPGLVDVLSHIELLATSYASAHDRRVLIERSGDTVQAFVDPDALEQIVANLLENAVRHTPEDTTITIRVWSADGRAKVSVADDGPGIPEADLPFLFEPFRRGNQRPEGTGVGLGLFIVANLCRAMGGDVAVDSTVGEGTTFTFDLPAERGSEVDGVEPAGLKEEA
jgi:signal transduction histidine kinase